MNNFRKFVLQRASDIGISQNEVAKRAKKTSGWLSKFLNEPQKDLRLSTFVDLAKALQMSPAKLFAVYIEEGTYTSEVNIVTESHDDVFKQALVKVFQALPREEQLAVLGDTLPILLAEARRLEDEEKR